MDNTRSGRVVWPGLLAVWAAVTVGTVSRLPTTGLPPVVAVLLWPSLLMSSVITLYALKQSVALLLFPVLVRRDRLVVAPARGSGLRVALLHCTADDFDPVALDASRRQSRPFDRVIILDDSRRPEVRARIDAYAARRPGVAVVRRPTRSGFKAGNLNNYLATATDVDFVVITDSDQELPADFVAGALGRFGADPTIGVVQGRHRAGRNPNRFTSWFAPLLESYIAVSQAFRTRCGFSAFQGRGAMISIGCLRAAGGIPEVVAEDIAFSVAVRRLGFRVAYAPELVCQEDYPIDYPAFRQQQRKAVEGNLEFLRHYLGMIVTGPLRSGEKIDLLAEQLAPVLGPLVGLGLFGTASAAAATGTALPGWIYLGAGLGAITPLLPEAVRRGVSELVPTRRSPPCSGRSAC